MTSGRSMSKILSVVGARPQFIKAAPVSRALRRRFTEVLVHTGQHYDAGMSDVFFRELGIPAPDHHLGVGSGSHGAQTGAMLAGIETAIMTEKPDWVLVYGDTNSTLAGALAAAKLHVPIAHVEAGLRSGNWSMPEEINRVLTDAASDLLLAPTHDAVEHLAREHVHGQVRRVGDVMLDALKLFEPAMARSAALETLGLEPGHYAVVTVHRAENTDDPARLAAILAGLARLDTPVVFPMHPRTRQRIADHGLFDLRSAGWIDPLGYLDMLALVRCASMVLTDSGGLQKEAAFLGVPCVTLRDQTEWPDTLELGWNTLVGADADRLVEAARSARSRPSGSIAELHERFGGGLASERICEALLTP